MNTALEVFRLVTILVGTIALLLVAREVRRLNQEARRRASDSGG